MSERSPVFSLRGLIVALVAASAALHLLIGAGRAHGWALEGAGLAAVGVVQMSLAVALVFSARRAVALTTIAALALPIVALVITRTAGYPFGPYDGFAPTVSSYDGAVIALGLAALSLIGGSLLAGPHLLGVAAPRFDTLAPLAVVLAAVPGLAVTSWVDDASYVEGKSHTHSHSDGMSMDAGVGAAAQQLTLEQRDDLAAQVNAAREFALSVPTLADALAAGWVKAGSPAVGGGQMVVDPTVDHRELTFDPARPLGLLFASDDDNAPVVGLEYAAWSETATPPSAFVGQDSMWHLHTGTCVVNGPSGDYAMPVDEPLTGVGCAGVDGERIDVVSFMMRAWVVPGWENPYGTFAHDHPAL